MGIYLQKGYSGSYFPDGLFLWKQEKEEFNRRVYTGIMADVLDYVASNPEILAKARG